MSSSINMSLSYFHAKFSYNEDVLRIVSVGKSFGSEGKQHRKHTASETQSHHKWSKKCEANHGIFPNQLKPGINNSLTTTDLRVHSIARQ